MFKEPDPSGAVNSLICKGLLDFFFHALSSGPTLSSYLTSSTFVHSGGELAREELFGQKPLNRL